MMLEQHFRNGRDGVMLRGPHRSSLYRVVAIGALIAGALVAGTAMAAPATPARSCDKTSGDSAIAACTRAIDSGKFKGHKLAILFSNRGAEWSKKGQHDRAITDYNEAIG